jgi:hypothetical protein
MKNEINILGNDEGSSWSNFHQTDDNDNDNDIFDINASASVNTMKLLTNSTYGLQARFHNIVLINEQDFNFFKAISKLPKDSVIIKPIGKNRKRKKFKILTRLYGNHPEYDSEDNAILFEGYKYITVERMS